MGVNVRLFRRALQLAKLEGRLVIIIEPIKSYALKTYGAKKRKWTSSYPGKHEIMDLQELIEYDTSGERHSSATDRKRLAIVSYGNGLRLSLEAARILNEKHGINSISVIDRPCLRGGAGPAQLRKILQRFDFVLFADESREQGCPSLELITQLVTDPDSLPSAPKVALVAASNSFIPLGEAAKVAGLYLSEPRIVASALQLLGQKK